MNRTGLSITLCLLLIAGAVLIAHGNTLTFDYVWEDRNGFVDDSPLREWKNIPRFFVRSAHEGFSVSHVTPYYRPVTVTLWALDWQLFRGNPAGSHLVNLLLHAGVAVVLFFLASRILGGDRLFALLAALLYAVHPAGMESVAYVSSRADLLCALFTGGAVLAWLRFRDGGGWGAAGSSLLLTALALLSKEPAVTLPLLVVACELLRGRERKWSSAVPFALVVAGYLLLRGVVLTRTAWDQTPFVERLWTAIHATGTYLLTLLAPLQVKTFYDVPTLFSFRQPEVFGMGVVILLWCGGAILAVRCGMTKGGVLALLVPLSILPMSNLPAMILPSPVAVRYLVIPLAIFSLAAAALLAPLRRVTVAGRGIRSGALPLLLLIPLFALLTVTSNGRWRDDDRFFAAVLADAPRSPLAFKLAANSHGKRGRGVEMARLYAAALELTRRRQLETARLMISLGYPERAKVELLKLPGAGDDPEVRELLARIR